MFSTDHFVRSEGGTSRYVKMLYGVIYTLFFLTPIFFLPWSLDVLEPHKQWLCVTLVSVGILVWLLEVHANKRLRLKMGWMHILPLLFLVSVLISSVLSIAGYQTWIGYTAQEYTSTLSLTMFVLLFYLLQHLMSEMVVLRRVLIALLSSSVLSGAVALFGMFDVVHLPFDGTRSLGFTTIGTINSFVAFMVVMMFLGLAVWIHSKHSATLFYEKGMRGFLLRSLIVIVTTMTLIGLLAIDFWIFWLVVIVGVLMLVSVSALTSTRSSQPRAFGLPVLVLCISSVFLFIPSPVRPDLPIVVSLSYEASWGVVQQSITPSMDRLLFGTGPGTFVYDYLAHKPVAVNQSPLWSFRFDRAKSHVLTLLATTGVVGVSLVGLFVLSLMVSMLRALKRESDVSRWQMMFAFFIGWSVLVVFHLFYSSNMTMSFLFWGISGILASMVGGRIVRKDLPQTPRLQVLIVFGATIGVLGILLVFFLLSSRLVADAAFAKAIAQDRAGGDTTDVVVHNLQRAVHLHGFNDVYYRNLSYAYVLQARALMQDRADQEPTAEDTQQMTETIQAAVQAMDQALRLAPHDVANWVGRGVLYRDLMYVVQGAEDAAAQAFVRAIELEPHNPAHYTHLGRVYLLVADRARQAQTSDDPTVVDHAKEQERLLLETAQEKFLAAVDLKSDDASAHYYLAATYERQGKLEEATTRMIVLRNTYPNDIGLAFQLSQLLIGLKRYDTAQQELERILELNPRYANALWYLAILHEASGETEKAVTRMRQVLELNPGNEVVQERLNHLESGRATTEIPEPIQEESL